MVAFVPALLTSLFHPSSLCTDLVEATLLGRPVLDGALITSSNDGSPLQQIGNASHNQNVSREEPLRFGEGEKEDDFDFTLFDWTVAFRHSVRLASENSGVANRSVALTLTPGVSLEPPPYQMSSYGAQEILHETDQDWEPIADYDNGTLLLTASANASVAVSNASTPRIAWDVLPTEKVMTTAEWLVRPSQGMVSMSRDLKSYLRQLVAEQHGDNLLRDKVDFAISLSSMVDLTAATVPALNGTTSNMTFFQKSARVRAYAPNFFAGLRRSFGIDPSAYLTSLVDESLPFVSFQSNSKGAHRVGGIFFFSRDGSYMIKTIKSDEVRAFLGNFLSKYGQYMKHQHGRNSLLSRCCGVYQVQLYTTKRINGTRTVVKSRIHTFAVMNSVFPPHPSKSITERFDLKGSALGRKCSAEEIKRKGSQAVLKDMDLAEEVSTVRSAQFFSGRRLEPTTTGEKSSDSGFITKEGLHIGPAAKAAMMTQLRKDVELLVRCNTIDYSLLVGVYPRRSPRFNFLCHVFARQKSCLDLICSDNLLLLSPACLALKTRLMFGQSFYWKAEKYLPVMGILQSASLIYNDMLERCGVNPGPLTRLYGERHGVPCVYYFGLIDFLQPYNLKKDTEYNFKTLKYGKNAGFSCIPPRPYAERFLAFLDRNIT